MVARRVTVALALGIVSLLVYAGCAPSGSADRPTDSVVSSAAAKTEATRTARVTQVTVVSGLPHGLRASTEGEFDFGSKQGSFTITEQPPGPQGGGAAGATTVIVSGDTIYSTLPSLANVPAGKHWLASVAPPGETGAAVLGLLSPASSASPDQLLSGLSALATDITVVGRTTLGGVPVTQYRLTLRPPHPSCAAELGPGHPVSLWVDGQGRVRKVDLQVGLPKAMAASGTVVETTTYGDFGVPVSVHRPPADEVDTVQQLDQQIAGGLHVSNLFQQGSKARSIC